MMGFYTLATVVYVEVVKVETKFIIKYRAIGQYFRAVGHGTTSDKSEAYRYTRTEIIFRSCFDKTRHVLIPVTK